MPAEMNIPIPEEEPTTYWDGEGNQITKEEYEGRPAPKWWGGVVTRRLVTKTVLISPDGGETKEMILSDEPYIEPKGRTMKAYEVTLALCVILACVLSVCAHSLLLEQSRVEALASEDRITQAINRKAFALSVQSLSTEERLRYIAILSDALPREEAPVVETGAVE